MKKKFPDLDFWLDILAKLEELSSDQISYEAIEMIKEFQTGNTSPTETWNFLKKLLDFIVFTGGASSFVIALIDVEPYYAPPSDECYQQANESVGKAPWRANCNW